MALQRAETSVIDGAIRDNLRLGIGMKNLSVENSKMVFGGKDESILEREKGSRLYLMARWNNMTSLGSSPETIKKME